MSVSKRIKQGKIDVDYEDTALLINYDVEIIEVDHNGMVLGVLEKKPEVRRIKIKTLSADKNMAQLASDIVEKCPKYIHPSRTEEVEQLLIKLRKTVHENTVNAPPAQHAQASAEAAKKSIRDRERERGADRSPVDGYLGDKGGAGSGGGGGGRDSGRAMMERAPRPDPLPEANISEIDDYLEMLYQVSGKTEKEREATLKLQERGTGMILKLCRDVMNLEQLIQNGTVMGALTRVLQEEFKKSIDLTFNILRIFLAFSNFIEMHSLMANYRIGVLTMKAIDFEVQRTELRDTERAEKEAQWAEELKKTKLNDPMNYPAVADRIKKGKEIETVRQQQFVRKQDKLLFVGFYILLNLAEDLNVERKMMKKGLVNMISTMLNKRFEDLLILCVTFLKKLSTIEENKETIKELNITEKLVRLISCSSQPLVMITLRALYNLSFDREIREQMLKTGFVPKLIGLLKTPVFRPKIMKLLYLLSMDDRCKSMATYTDGIPILMGMVINFPQERLAKELGAVMINFSLNPRNCEQMVANKGLNLLMDRLEDKRDDVLLVKIIRNISMWTFNQQQETDTPEMNYRCRGLWSPHIKLLFTLLKECDGHDMLVELIGILANMTIYDLPQTSSWAKLVKDYHLLGMFSKMLVPGMAQNDLLLELIMMIGSMASDTNACNTIASSTLINQLYQLWKEKADDTEILLQLLHCFHKLFLHEASREEAMYSTRVVVDIINCLTHPNAAVRSKADKITEIVLEFDRSKEGEPGQLGSEIIRKRFEGYNSQWVSAMNQSDMLSHNTYASSNYGGGGNVNMGSYDEYGDGEYGGVAMHGSNSIGGSSHGGSYNGGGGHQPYYSDTGSVAGSSRAGGGGGGGDQYDRQLRGSREQEISMVNSAQYFSDKVDHTITMESYNKHSADAGGRVTYTGGGDYKVNFGDSVDDSGDSWQNNNHYK